MSIRFSLQQSVRLGDAFQCGTDVGHNVRAIRPGLRSLGEDGLSRALSGSKGLSSIARVGRRVSGKAQAFAGQGEVSNMEATQMDAKQTVLSKLFDDNHFFVLPAYQRPYSWQKEHAEDLLSDLWEAANQGNVPIR